MTETQLLTIFLTLLKVLASFLLGLGTKVRTFVLWCADYNTMNECTTHAQYTCAAQYKCAVGCIDGMAKELEIQDDYKADMLRMLKNRYSYDYYWKC